MHSNAILCCWNRPWRVEPRRRRRLRQPWNNRHDQRGTRSSHRSRSIVRRSCPWTTTTTTIALINKSSNNNNNTNIKMVCFLHRRKFHGCTNIVYHYHPWQVHPTRMRNLAITTARLSITMLMMIIIHRKVAWCHRNSITKKRRRIIINNNNSEDDG